MGLFWKEKLCLITEEIQYRSQKVLTMYTHYLNAFDDIKFGTVYYTIIDLGCREYAHLLTCRLHLDQCKTEVNVIRL